MKNVIFNREHEDVIEANASMVRACARISLNGSALSGLSLSQSLLLQIPS